MMRLLLALFLSIASAANAAGPNRVLALDGDGDYVRLPAHVFDRLEAATIEAWVKWESFGFIPHWFSYGSSPTGLTDRAQVMGIDYQVPSSKLFFYINFRKRNTQTSARVGMLQGRWVHLAAVSGPGGMKLYLNGVLVTQNKFEGSFSTLGNGEEAYLGRSVLVGNSDFHGELDEVRVWNVARSAAQIRQTMRQRLTGGETGLEALWNFDADKAADQGPHAHHGHLHGDAVCRPAAWPGTTADETNILEGRVLDQQGRTVESAQIRLEQGAQSVSLNPKGGSYRVFLVGEGVYDGAAKAPDSGQWQLGFRLEAGQTQRRDFVLRRSSRLAGRVEALDGTGLGDVLVEALRLDGKGPSRVRASAFSDPKGGYRLDNLKPGAYLLRCHVPGGPVYYAADGSGRGPDTLAVGPLTRREDLDFTVRPFKKGRWKHHGVFEGLGSHDIRHTLQRRDGRLFVATHDEGLWTFDGARFERLEMGGDPGRDHIRALCEDSAGVLWIATNDGVLLHDGWRFLPAPHPAIAAAQINQIIQGQNGDMWLATNKDGAWRWDGADLTRLGEEDGLPHRSVRTLYQDRDGILWLATERGVARYDGKRFLPFAASGLANHRVYAIHQGRDGALYFATRRGLSRYRDGAFDHLLDSTHLPKIVYSVFEDRDGYIWFGSGKRLLRYDGSGLVAFGEADGLHHLPARHIGATRDGRLWFAARSTLSSYQPDEMASFSIADGLPGASVQALHRRDAPGGDTPATGQVWVGTDGGLGRIDPDGTVLSSPEPPAGLDGPVTALEQSADGMLWVVGAKGLWRYDGTAARRQDLDGNFRVHDLLEDGAGDLWLATERGVFRRRDGRFRPYTLGQNSDQPFVGAARDGRGDLWFVTRQGNARRQDGRRAVDHKLAGRHRKIHALYGAPDSSLWLGTGRGVIRLGGPDLDQVQDFISDRRVFFDNITSIRSHAGKLYCASHSGLLLYDQNAWSSLDTEDGLPGNKVQSLAFGPDGTVWIGTAAGLARYRPARTPPQVRIAGVRIDTAARIPPDLGPVTVGTRITVKAEAVDFRTSAQKRQYRFRLEGDPWGPVSRADQFDYQPGRAGRHTVEVQAVDRDLNYSAPARLHLEVVWPWYRDLRVQGAGGAALGLMLLSIFLLSRRTLVQRRETERLRQEMLDRERHARGALEQSNAELQEANRAKSAFLANMSHEIRTPLNIMLGYAQVMRRNADITEQTRQQLKTIQDSGSHLLGLINEVLDLSKIEAGHQERQDADFDLVPLIDGLRSMWGLSCREKGLEFRVEWLRDESTVEPPGALGLAGDEGKLRQILINLLSNAVKFTARGQVLLRVGLPADGREAGRYLFSVSDTGEGIPPELENEIFQPFSQGEDSRRTPGTGLGLAIAHRYVELLGGRLALDSRSGQGSVFSFFIPLAEATSLGRSTADPAAGVDARRIKGLAPGFAVNALVVDDVDENRRVLSDLLKTVGAQVDTLGSGEEAIEYLAGHTPDIVFIDMWMPGLSGLETAQRMGNLGTGQRPRWVAVSASTLEHEQRRYLEAGFDDFIGKPVDEEQLYQTLARLLQVEFEYAEGSAFDPAQASLPAALWRSLHAAARANDLTGLDQALKAVEASGPQGPPLAQALGTLIDQIDMDGIMALLESIRHE